MSTQTKVDTMLIAKRCPLCDHLIEVPVFMKDHKLHYEYADAKCSKCDWSLKKIKEK